MAIPISNVTRRVVYAASGTGPYSFTFEILAAGDIAVYRDDTLLTITTDYTVTINANGTGSITLTATPTGATQIAIVGNRTIARSTDFTTGGDFFANTLNDELDQQTIFAQQNAEGLQRALQAPQTDPTTIDMTLPRASVRALKVLSFDATGNPSATEFIGSNRGNWASGTLYYVRDVIKDTTNNNIWQAVTQHTSSGSLPIDTNADVAKWTLLVDAAAAATSAAAAASSASAASTSASNASTSASNASTSATNASNSASSASTSATNASNSATAAASSASAASGSASAASTSETNAAASESAAATSASNASSSASAASTSASNASTSASNAASSASAASTSASNAAASESAASTSASNAATSATNAANSATSASNSATSATNAQTAAEAALDSFDDRYLGAKSSAPSVDNDGNALLTGALYWNTPGSQLYVWDGAEWDQAAFNASGLVASFNTRTGAVTLTSSDVTTALTFTPLSSSDIGVTVQAYDATYLVDADIGVSVQAYDADTAKLDVAQAFTAQQTFAELKETTYTLGTSGSIALDPANGSIQSSTLSGDPTFTDSLEAGQTVVLMLNGGASYTVTWPTTTWVTSGGNVAPTLTANDTLVFWKVSTTLYGAYVGSYT
jgi:chemotaxis protein histidine kinase CheA